MSSVSNAADPATLNGDQLRWALAWASVPGKHGAEALPLLPWLTVPCPQLGRFIWVDDRSQPHGAKCPTCHGRDRIPMSTEQHTAYTRFGLVKSGFRWTMRADDDRSVATRFELKANPAIAGEATEGDGFTSTLRAAYRAVLAAGWQPGPLPPGM
ncbi:MAG: hypothetical protein FJ318_02395 [SAR202 cluster bacterium]|nr:hypothetical protein [SAR202 cluster bacterium]